MAIENIFSKGAVHGLSPLPFLFPEVDPDRSRSDMPVRLFGRYLFTGTDGHGWERWERVWTGTRTPGSVVSGWGSVLIVRMGVLIDVYYFTLISLRKY